MDKSVWFRIWTENWFFELENKMTKKND